MTDEITEFLEQMNAARKVFLARLVAPSPPWRGFRSQQRAPVQQHHQEFWYGKRPDPKAVAEMLTQYVVNDGR